MDDEVVNLREYGVILGRHRNSILAMTFIAVVFATLIVFLMNPVYKSTATLIIETEEKKVVSIEDVYSGGQKSREYLNTQFEVIKSKSLARKVIAELNLKNHPYFLSDDEGDEKFDSTGSPISTLIPDAVAVLFSPESATSSLDSKTAGGGGEISDDELFQREILEKFSDMMTVTPVRNTQLVHISFEASDNQLAALLANQMAQMYINDQMDSRLNMTAQANRWLSERLVKIRDKLRISESELQAYRERENLLDAGGVTGLISIRLQELNQELLAAQQRLSSLEAANNQIVQIRGGGYQEFHSIPAVLEDKLVSQLINGRSDKLQEFDTLSKRYGSKHPKFISAKASLNAATKSLKGHVLSVVDGIKHQYQLALSSESATQKTLARTKEEMQNINRKQHQLGLLQREVEANRQMYGLFLNRLKETTESTGLDKANARIIDQAIAELEPVKPKKKLIILIAGFVGLGLGMVIAFIFEHLNNTLKSGVDLEERLNLAVLGVLPLINEKVHDLWQSVKSEPQSAFTEGIRTIRTGVILSSLDDPHKIIMVTSSVPDEGKSITAINTAIGLSEMHKVLLIDTDLRKPSIGGLFGFGRNAKGLADLLVGTKDLKSTIHRWGDSQLYVLPSGAIPNNPLELISSNAFKKLLEAAAKHFNYIIIDTPPVLPVSDACLISTLVDGVVFVIKADSTPLPLASDGINRLRQSGAHIIGGVLNQYDVKKHQQYGEYGNYAYSGGYYSESYGALEK